MTLFRFKLWLVRAVLQLQNLALASCRFVLFKSEVNSKPCTILAYRTARLGDFINSIPALVVLRQRFPAARIALLTTVTTMKAWQSVTNTYLDQQGSLPWLPFVVPSLVDKAYVFSVTDWRTGLAQARQFMREFKPEATFILPYSGEGGTSKLKKLIFLWLAGVRSPVYGWQVRSTTGFIREVQYRAGMFEHQVWGPLRAVMEHPLIPLVEEENVVLPLTIDSDSEIWAQELWARQGWNSEKVVAVFPGGFFAHKRWPVDKFIQLCQILRSQERVTFVVVGAGTDAAICDQLCRALLEPGSYLNLAGQTTVTQLAAVLKRCALFVGNDSGPAHLASAVGCPCVTLTSSIEYPGWWEPWNSRNRTIRHSVPCENCFSYTECPLGTRACIEGIEVSRVLVAVRSV